MMEGLGLLLFVLNTAIALWNAYASGYNYEVGKCIGDGFLMFVSASTVLLSASWLTLLTLPPVVVIAGGFLGEAVVEAGVRAMYLAEALLLVFLVFSGFLIVVHSILLVKNRGSLTDYFVAGYNIGAYTHDVFVAVNWVPKLIEMALEGGDDEKGEGKIILLAVVFLIIAFLFAVIITLLIFSYGRKHAREQIGEATGITRAY